MFWGFRYRETATVYFSVFRVRCLVILVISHVTISFLRAFVASAPVHQQTREKPGGERFQVTMMRQSTITRGATRATVQNMSPDPAARERRSRRQRGASKRVQRGAKGAPPKGRTTSAHEGVAKKRRSTAPKKRRQQTRQRRKGAQEQRQGEGDSGPPPPSREPPAAEEEGESSEAPRTAEELANHRDDLARLREQVRPMKRL